MVYRVKVPATSANVGAGFDTMGLALAIYNIFDVEEIESGLEFVGFEEKYCNEDNLIYKAMEIFFEKVLYKKKGYKISLIECDIPTTRGLGSSSTCIIAGILAANKISKANFKKDDIINVINEIEGHPDNVVPALLGGFVVSVVEKSKVYYNRIELDENLIFCAAIPNFEFKTEISRSILPKSYSSVDVFYNLSRVALTATAFFSKNYELLLFSCHDKLHEPYRSKHIKDYDNIVDFF